MSVDPIPAKVVKSTGVDDAHPRKDGEQDRLPIGGKDDAFDAQELGQWFPRDQIMRNGLVEENQKVERDADRDVINHGQVRTGRIERKRALYVGAGPLADKVEQSGDRCNEGVLQNAPFDGEKVGPRP